MSIGDYKQRTINALAIGKDLHRTYIFETLTGSQSLEKCLAFITKGTGFTYNIIGSFPSYSFSESFGNAYADELFLRLAQNFQFEFFFKNKKITITKSLGQKNQFLFIDRSTVPKINETSDYTVITTRIHGEGKKDENGKPLIVADYVSPKAKLFGLSDAQPVNDERFTDKENLLAYMKTKVQDVPFVQYSVDSIYLDHIETFPKLGDYGYLRDRFDIDVEVRINGITTYPQSNKAPKVTFGNRLLSIEKMTAQLQKAKKDTSKYLQETTKQVQGFQKQLTSVAETAEDAAKKAQKAIDGQIFGKPITTESGDQKVVELTAPIDDEALGLTKGEAYYVLTHAQGVDGLKAFILDVAPVYTAATEKHDGLLTKEDKRKLDGLNPEKIEQRLTWLEDHIKE